jgi:DtxR family Mn-dependent transcriptional regulator
MITNRDKQYLRAVFTLKGATEPVGPNELATKLGVSKVCAFQKMRRLEAMGYGEYYPRKGLQLNETGISMVEQEVKRHHVIERFLENTLKITSQEACDHSSNIGPFINERLIDNIANNMEAVIDCRCGHCLDTSPNGTELKHCHWLNNSI